uniref:Uncharacterized protein n=1 Tax=Anguilla anguilla TaxID=7936 RepID=A0A0E9SNN8_ANGAN
MAECRRTGQCLPIRGSSDSRSKCSGMSGDLDDCTGHLANSSTDTFQIYNSVKNYQGQIQPLHKLTRFANMYHGKIQSYEDERRL